MSNIIIMAAGEQSRWRNHLNTRKHLITVAGETLLQRTVRLFKKYTNRAMVTITAKDDDYYVEGARLIKPVITGANGGLDKFRNTIDLWDKNERNIIVYGDVFFTENCVRIITGCNRMALTMFGRYSNSYITGRGGELFAMSFYSNDFERVQQAMTDLIALGVTRGGWELYRKLEGLNLHDHEYGKNFIEINDLTDDFDYPGDYDTWIQAYRTLSQEYLYRQVI
jgi:hypothetical protein